MSGPTEAEIRQAIADEFPSGRAGGSWGCYADDLLGFAVEAAEAVTNAGRVGDEGGLWAESDELQKAIDDAAWMVSRQCVAVIVEGMTAALLQFAREHPEAPRAVAVPTSVPTSGSETTD